MKLIIFAFIPLILSIGITPVFAVNHDVMSPYQQVKNGIAAEDIECKDLLKLMIRPNGNPACVNKKSIHPLEFWDWTLRITTDINKLDGLNWYEPENRNLGFRNIDKVVPYPLEISKGSGPVHEFGSDPQDLSKIPIEYYDEIITLDEYLERSHTDAFLVLKGNDIVYEKYLRMDPNERHAIQSPSKTIVAALLGNHVVNGDVDLNKKMKEYFPDIGSGYAEATLQQVLDMQVTNEFSFDFDDPNAHIHQYEVSAGFKPDVENKWPEGHRGFIKTNIASDDITGKESSQYQDPNTDIGAWILEDATGEKYYTLFEERIYQHLGAEQDAVVVTDVQGNAFAAGGWYMTLRDFARYATVWMNEGVTPDGERVIPLEWVNQLRDSTKGPYYTGYEEINIRYHNMMTTDGIFLAHAGWAGQFMYTDPDAKVAYVMFSALTEANGGVEEDKTAMYEVGMAISDYFTDKYQGSYLTN